MTIHVIGAGLSGLAAAVELARRGESVAIYEAAGQAGGRCRSYFDRELDREIDNGNHLVLSGNDNVRRYLALLGSSEELVSPAGDGFRFLDLLRDRAFVVRPNESAIPWWVLSRNRRIPDTGPLQYLAALRLATAGPRSTVGEILPHDEVYRILWEPLAVSALNTPADEASARGFWKVIEKTLARGGRFSKPLIARHTLAKTFVEPAIAYLERAGVTINFGARLRGLSIEDSRIAGLSLDGTEGAWRPGDTVIMATAPAIARRLVPQLIVPSEDEPIVNAHFATEETPAVDIVAIVGGAAQWVFRRPGVASVTVSAARSMVDEPAETLAPRLWHDVYRAFPELGPTLPRFRIVKEKRATIRQSPADELVRPGARTPFGNLFLAGDWTDTGLPATIEGSLLSGFRAADLASSRG